MKTVLTLFSLLLLCSTAHAEKSISIQLTSQSGSTEFLAIGRPSAIKIVGKGDGPKGSLTLEANQISGSASFDLNSLDTGINTRNEHMKKKYLETEKYPQAKLTIVKLQIPNHQGLSEFKANALPFTGVLNLHGVEKPMSGSVDLERKGNGFEMITHFTIVIDDFSIPTPGYAGITMAKDVQITVKESLNTPVH